MTQQPQSELVVDSLEVKEFFALGVPTKEGLESLVFSVHAGSMQLAKEEMYRALAAGEYGNRFQLLNHYRWVLSTTKPS
jgi:hypothetical protein